MATKPVGAAPAAPTKAVHSLDVKILDREYRVAAPETERDSLLISVAYLDQKMREIRDAGKIVGTERIAVMAALNIAHELLTAKSPSGIDVGESRRKIIAMQSAIDQVIAAQDKLF
jgi:cell division protein ZapA